MAMPGCHRAQRVSVFAALVVGKSLVPRGREVVVGGRSGVVRKSTYESSSSVVTVVIALSAWLLPKVEIVDAG